MACPYAGKYGYVTKSIQDSWLRAHPEVEDNSATRSLVADLDTRKPLYPWQLFSLIGSQGCHKIVHAFYTRVYADTEDLFFRDAFANIFSFDHHVATQTQFWADAFGGGRYYHGADFRVNFHHKNNANQVMNAAGQRRWMYHMRKTLNEDMKEFFRAGDPRVKACIVDFLQLRMKKYAHDHNWKFDPSDFDFGEEVHTGEPEGQEAPNSLGGAGSYGPTTMTGAVKAMLQRFT